MQKASKFKEDVRMTIWSKGVIMRWLVRWLVRFWGEIGGNKIDGLKTPIKFKFFDVEIRCESNSELKLSLSFLVKFIIWAKMNIRMKGKLRLEVSEEDKGVRTRILYVCLLLKVEEECIFPMYILIWIIF